MSDKALIIIDLQNDFCDGGAIPVPNALQTVPIINRLRNLFETIAFIKDWHPFKHCSFSDCGGRLPRHSVKDTHGSKLNKGLIVEKTDYIFHKGTTFEYDSSSAFYNGKNSRFAEETGLHVALNDKGIKTLYICGLPLDTTVFSTVLDGIKFGYDVWLVVDASKGTDEVSTRKKIEHMVALGVRMISSDELLKIHVPVAKTDDEKSE